MKYIFSIFIVVCLFSDYANTQILIDSCHDILIEELISEGFLNVDLNVIDSDQLEIAFENRHYRFEREAISKVVEIVQATNCTSEIKNLEIFSKVRNIPYLHCSYLADTVANLLHLKNSKYNFSLNSSTFSHNAGQYRFEFEIEPQLRLALGGSPDAVIHQVNLLPSLNFFLWEGAMLRFQYIIPVLDEFERPRDIVRPGVLTFNQILRLPQNIMANVTVGYFQNTRYGVEGELGKWMFGDKVYAGARVGYTGYASFPKLRTSNGQIEKGWEYSDISYLDYSMNIDGRINKWNFQFGAEYSKHLLRQHSLRVYGFRQFDELTIGFFGYKIFDRGNNYGFNISIPILPKKYSKPKLIQIKPSRWFRYEYETSQNRILQYNSGSSLEEFFENMHPSLLLNQN